MVVFKPDVHILRITFLSLFRLWSSLCVAIVISTQYLLVGLRGKLWPGFKVSLSERCLLSVGFR